MRRPGGRSPACARVTCSFSTATLLRRTVGIGPALPVEIGSAAPRHFSGPTGQRAPDLDVHHRPRVGLDLPDIAQRHLVGKARKKNAMRDQMGKRRLRGARKMKNRTAVSARMPTVTIPVSKLSRG